MIRKDIRAEIIEMINAGTSNVSKIVSYFKRHHPEANMDVVREEAKELVKGV